MHLQKLSILNFKNITDKTFNFHEKINCFTGDNGIGKTNVLDAIYYLSFTKSYFNPVAVQNIKHGESFFVLNGDYVLQDRTEKIVCSLKKGQKKVLKRNGKIYDKLSEHIGRLPLVMISPADSNLIVEGSDVRRKFIDSVISMLDKEYLRDLISYNRIIIQRNALLKYFRANRTFDALNLKVYDGQLPVFGTKIFKKRKVFLMQFSPIFNAKYQMISGNKEQVNLHYKSHLHEGSMEKLLEQSIERDRMLQYTGVGIHKDDLSFDIGNHPIKKFGSQGQQKSYLIALKLAQFEFLKQKSKIVPILLLDDIFDKLDEKRVAQVIDLVHDDVFGQIFITDTHRERTEKAVKNSNNSYKIFDF
ncbi:MAG: DNA replication and repair protein RecF [Flavobacteriaceae bacterium]|nr:MAG: DNA replication and repair protein RecF [Flavobacteriaceae bacterium]